MRARLLAWLLLVGLVLSVVTPAGAQVVAPAPIAPPAPGTGAPPLAPWLPGDPLEGFPPGPSVGEVLDWIGSWGGTPPDGFETWDWEQLGKWLVDAFPDAKPVPDPYLTPDDGANVISDLGDFDAVARLHGWGSTVFTGSPFGVGAVVASMPWYGTGTRSFVATVPASSSDHVIASTGTGERRTVLAINSTICKMWSYRNGTTEDFDTVSHGGTPGDVTFCGFWANGDWRNTHAGNYLGSDTDGSDYQQPIPGTVTIGTTLGQSLPAAEVWWAGWRGDQASVGQLGQVHAAATLLEAEIVGAGTYVPPDLSPPPSVAPAPTPSTTLVPAPTIPTAPQTDPDDGSVPASPTTDVRLGDRIGGFFDTLLSGLGSLFTWLGDLLTALIQAVIDAIWGAITWLRDEIEAIVQSLGDLLIRAIGGVITAIQVGVQAIVASLTAVIQWLSTIAAQLGSIFTTLVQFMTSMVTQLGQVLAFLANIAHNVFVLLSEVVAQLAALPQLLVDLLMDALQTLFVPSGPIAPDVPTWVTEWTGEFSESSNTWAGLIDTAMGDGCLPDWGFTYQGAEVSFTPPAPGCGNGPGGALTAADSEVSDLFGFRGAIRAGATLLLVMAFVGAVIAWMPWSPRHHNGLSDWWYHR